MAEAYAAALLADSTTRLHAAVRRWPAPLPDWVAQRSLAVAQAAAGVDPLWPWDVEPEATDAERARAREVMSSKSAIRD